MKKEIEFKSITLLGAKWAKKEKEKKNGFPIQDYACNYFYAKLADIDDMLEVFPKNSIYYKLLKIIRRRIQRRGISYWVGNSDILTNLAIKAGEEKEIEW